MRLNFVVAGSLLAVSLSASAMPPVAWMQDPYFAVHEKIGSDGISEMIFPDGQSSANWQERVLLRRLGKADGRSSSAWMQAIASESLADCETFYTLEFPSDRPLADDDKVYAWFCYKEKGQERGRLEFAKVVQSQGAVYLMAAGGRTRPYSKNDIPRMPTQDRQVQAVGRFAACKELTQLQCVPGQAILGETPAIEPTATEKAEIDLALARGLEIYRQDHLAWYGTDFAQENHMVPEKGKGLGFLAIPGPGLSGTVYFMYRGRDDVPQAYVVVADEQGRLSKGETLQALPPEVALRQKAIHTASTEAHAQVCSEHINVAVMPHENGKDWWVYLLSGSTRKDQAWIGGHARIHVSADGSKVLSVDPSTKACLSINPEELRRTTATSAAPVTQILTDVPSEYHVFQSLTNAVPIIVVTNAGVWRVSGNTIEKRSLEVTDKVERGH